MTDEVRIYPSDKYTVIVEIDGVDYRIYVNPVCVRNDTIGDYWRLTKSLSELITTSQLNEMSIAIKRRNNPTILFSELVRCFERVKDDNGMLKVAGGRDKCICGVHITEVYTVRNYVKEREEKSGAVFYNIGCVCIDNWKNSAGMEDKLSIEAKMFRNKYKRDDPDTKRCIFCGRKTNTKRCVNCKPEIRQLCAGFISELKTIRAQKHPPKCQDCGCEVKPSYKRCYNCEFPNECFDCGESIRKQYKYCFECK